MTVFYRIKNCFVNSRVMKMKSYGVKEVRSKILTPLELETTGGNSFSLEEFEKMLFTI